MSTQHSGAAEAILYWLKKCLPFLAWQSHINRQSLRADIIAGLTGAIVVLPQGVAYAMIAGLPPEYGLYTAMVTPVIAGLFGSSLHLVSGPAAAISIVVFSVVSGVVPPDSGLFIPAVLTLTLLTGLIQLGLGLARLGTLVNFISHTVVIGFTAGAAVLIATSQMKYTLGIDVPSGSSFFASWQFIVQQLPQTNGYALLIALSTMVVVLLVRRINPALPAMLIGMITGSLLCWLLEGADQGVVLLGALSGQLPELAWPELSLQTISELLPGAVAVAVLGLVEAVSIARAIALRSGQRIEGNQEFIGQGLSNMVGSFFSCYAGSGSFTRTGVNYEAGAQTPLAAIFAALILLLILLYLPEVTVFLPLPVMAGTILLIAWGLIDQHHITRILRSNKQEIAVFLLTFTATLVVELEYSVYLGVALSLILYLQKTSRPQVTEVAPKSFSPGLDLRSTERFDLPVLPQLKLLRIDGSVFFGATDHIQQLLQQHSEPANKQKQDILLVCSGINFIDLAGADMLWQEAKRLEHSGQHLYFCSVKHAVMETLSQSGYLDQIGEARFFTTTEAALSALTEHTSAPSGCEQCHNKIFNQC
ncbi:SulP family inorganic anion transporter [Oceanospirillum sediminis]|uniref:SulP family inorganic anion transporter n=1 Tax=Oceanospirillum sediminis TaxID=2760088 RepID=A0A839IJR0_9GAMM|nr:SulP family inorganic anion transporter [Oceanospirillum sediminis]MBB1485168.1 SulP family inorganic anion transporter [Oceanospirillum sediminis]